VGRPESGVGVQGERGDESLRDGDMVALSLFLRFDDEVKELFKTELSASLPRDFQSKEASSHDKASSSSDECVVLEVVLFTD
jgi:hypothetical protein